MTACPFCNADLADFHAYTMSTGVDLTILTISLCVECGEPIAVIAKGWRKPTPDEYLIIAGDERLTRTRAVFLELQRTTRPPIKAMFETLWNEKLDGKLTCKDVNTPERMKLMVEDIFMTGVACMLGLFEDARDADTAEDFETKMLVIQTEMRAYGQYAEERKRAAGQTD